MSTLKQREARRLKNLELGQRDAANRCHVCKLNLLTVDVIYETLAGEKFCSPECRDQHMGVTR